MAVTNAQREAAARVVVDDFAPGAPEAVRTMAAAMLADSLQDPPYENEVKFSDQSASTHQMGAYMLRRCGASSLLAPWRRPRARVIEAVDATAPRLPANDDALREALHRLGVVTTS